MKGELQFYWRLLLRRLPAMTGLLLLCSSIGFVLMVKLPTTYEATATLLVEAPQIPQNLAESTVRTGAAEQLEVIRRRLMTRANLIEIANKFRVFRNDPTISPNEVVALMRQQTTIKSRGKPLITTISFSAGNPKVAADVVNEYLTLILDANVRLRTDQAENTLQFFENQVEQLDNELSAINTRILKFRQQNANALPENLEFRMKRLSLLQERLERLERDKASLRDQRSRIVTVFEQTGQLEIQQQTKLSPQERELKALEEELENALVVYSPTNPRIRILQSRVEKLRAVVTAELGAESDANPQQALFDVTLAEIDGQLSSIGEEINRIEAEAATLEQNINLTPQNGIALDSLRRDAANLQSQYNNAVSRLATASVGEQIELSAKGQRVSVVENATVPTEPASPNRPMVAAAGVGSGLALAIGLFMLLELLNRTIRRPAEFIKHMKTQPLASIPYIESARQRRVRRLGRVALLLAVITGVPLALWAIDTYYRPLDLIARQLLDSIGLT